MLLLLTLLLVPVFIIILTPIKPEYNLEATDDFSVYSNTHVYGSFSHGMSDINPATGLPMLDGRVDLGGNIYGYPDSGMSNISSLSSLSMWDDGMVVGGSMHDPFGHGMSDINPANGLPMLDGGIDVCGNAYGFDD